MDRIPEHILHPCTRWWKTCQKYMPVLCQEYMLFRLPLNIQPRSNTQHQGRVRGGVGWRRTGGAPLLLCVERWLNIQWQAETYHIFLAEDGHTF